MIKRGKILRAPKVGPGLLMVEGRQYSFVSEAVWKSDTPPTPGLLVNVEFDTTGKVRSLAAVPDQQIGDAVPAIATRIRISALAVTTALALTWWLLAALSVQLPEFGKTELTFWEVLGFLDAGRTLDSLNHQTGGLGFYAIAALIALSAPLLGNFFRNRWTALGGVLPLAYTVVVAIAFATQVENAIQTTSLSGAHDAKAALEAVWTAITLEPGAYLSMLASIYLAVFSVRHLLLVKADKRRTSRPPEKQAA